ncbi:MAG: hypothetical protein V1804_01260 [Patescibacteria group bacterium]
MIALRRKPKTRKEELDWLRDYLRGESDEFFSKLGSIKEKIILIKIGDKYGFYKEGEEFSPFTEEVPKSFERYVIIMSFECYKSCIKGELTEEEAFLDYIYKCMKIGDVLIDITDILEEHKHEKRKEVVSFARKAMKNLIR